MLKRALHYFTFLCLVGLLVTGCSGTSTIDTPPVPGTLPTPFPGFTFPILDLAGSQIPLPNDLLRNPVTGKLDFPGTAEPFLAANSLDGWSTAGDILIDFRGGVVPESVTNDTLPVINTTTGNAAPMTYSVEDTPQGATITCTPLYTLDPSTRYLVITTNGIISADSGTPILSDSAINILKDKSPLVEGDTIVSPALIAAGVDLATAQRLEAVRQTYIGIWTGAETATGQSRADIPLAFEFTTETIRQVLPSLRSQIVNNNNNIIPTLVGANPAAIIANNPALATLPVAAGNPNPLPEIGDPNFLGAAAVPSVPQFVNAILNNQVPGLDLPPELLAQLALVPIDQIGRIHFVSFEAPIYRQDNAEGFFTEPPVQQVGTRTIPALVFFPLVAADPRTAPQLPVMIFQHGITGQKELAFGLANGVNGQNYALIAIDLELHGALSIPNQPSGTGFINIANLRNSRDNIRTSVTNLYCLINAIVSGRSDFDDSAALGAIFASPGNEFIPAASQVPASPIYVGHSLGAIVGTVLHATEADLVRSAQNVGGGRISKLLQNSATFRQPIVDGLAAAGVLEGTPQFAQFFLIAQAVIDDSDSINYGKVAIDGTLRGNSTAQILQQANLVDLVVPPSAQSDQAIQFGQGTSSPAFSQVDALGTPLGIAAQASTPFDGPGVYQIPTFGHGAILGTDGVAAATAIFGQAFNFDATGSIIDTGIRARQIPTEPVAEDLEQYRHAVKF